MVVGSPSMDRRISSILGSKMAKKKRMVVVGLKSHNRSREMLLRLLTMVVDSGDTVLAVHVQEPNDNFDPNTFHIHEDLCKSKQVDFQVKISAGGDSFITILTHQVRVHFATTLVLGCSSPRLPPTCSLLIMDNGGRVLIQQPGTSQQGSTIQFHQPSVVPSLPTHTSAAANQSETIHQSIKPSAPSSSTTSSPVQANTGVGNVSNVMHFSENMEQIHLKRLEQLDVKGTTKRFTPQELSCATNKFVPQMLIGEGGHGKVYRANLEDGRTAAVKVLKTTERSGEELIKEVEMLSRLNHENIVGFFGYCYSKDMKAMVYDLLQESLKHKLRQLGWSERMKVAVGLAKALDYLHHSCSPPIIHRDVKSSNVLLTQHCQPQLSDFGAAVVYHQSLKPSANMKPFHVVGTFGYLAPEYMMYGKVDEKIDVYSYGVVLLELISGKEAIQTSQATTHESLVLWARSLLSRGLCERLIDPQLNGDYEKQEMERMMTAARLCLMHSSSRRPTMKMILKLLEEPEYWVKMQREREEFINRNSFKRESRLRGHYEFTINEIPLIEDI
ncbi:PREDICTED: pto-interacting protein 1-like isoform X2 [Nelumbo nucifera]|uniref:Protein kinase domain-containing protein n=2 Tax=Nelumbo nucifera TaxID=4432 RepID=A0A822ZB12_NELNU|nr:PREDICTED: pto-interacting protein 1-like isoform X2 [Nelumbo nucifera]DAD41753.1 TPA_asm: hypothetical protein HUJ06_016076 [Nelumbo nucifera]